MTTYPFTNTALALAELLDCLEDVGRRTDEETVGVWLGSVIAGFIGSPSTGSLGHRELPALFAAAGLDMTTDDWEEGAALIVSYLIGTGEVHVHCDCGRRRTDLCRALARPSTEQLLQGARDRADGTLDVALAHRHWREVAIARTVRDIGDAAA